MSVKTCVTGCSCQAFSIFVGDVLTVFGVSILLYKAEIDDVNVMLSFASSHQKVIRLNISVEIETTMDVLHSLDHLVCKHQHCFQTESSLAFPEEFL